MKKALLAIILMVSFTAIKAEQPGGFIGAGNDTQAPDMGTIVVEDQDENFTTGLNDLSQSIATFKGAALTDNSAMTVSDILGEVPGIYLDKSGIMSFGSGLFTPSVMKIRGLGETPNSGILTVIDGRPQSMGIYRHPFFDTLALDSIDSIEVIKGPGGVLYGNQAVAGVINIRTKKRELEGGSYTLGTMIGNDFTQNHFMDAVFKKDEIDMNVSGSYSSTGGARPNADSYLENVHAHGGYEIQKDLVASVNIDYAYNRNFNPGPLGYNWPRDAEATQTIQRDGDFRVDYKLPDYTGSTIFFTDSGSNKFLLSEVPQFYPVFVAAGTPEYSQYENHGLRVMNEWVIFPGNSTKAGFDWQYFGGFYSSFKSAVWHENDYAPYFSISQEAGIFGISAGLRYDINSAWGSVPVPQAGFKVSLFDQQTIYVNASKGFKTPAMGQWVIFPYDNLSPEQFWQYEIGTTHTIFESLTYNIALYQTEGSNVLQVDPVDGKLKNSGFILMRGVDADVSAKFLDIFRAGISGSYVDPRDKTANMALLSGSAYIKAELIKKGNIKVGVDFAKDRYNKNISDLGNPAPLKLGDYAALNISADYRMDIFGTDTSFYVDADNILDNTYEVKAYYPVPGFLIKGGLTVRL